VNLAGAMKRAGLWSLALWGWGLFWSGLYGFSWNQVDGQVARALSVALAVWTAFFAVFLTWLSLDLQTRRKLLIGRLEPSPEEWRRLEAAPARSLAGAFWRSGLAAGALGALASGLLAWGLCGLRLEGAHGRLPHLAAAFLVPLVAVSLAAPLAVRRAAFRFVPAIERAPALRLPRGRYLILHNVLPYTLFNALAGFVVLSSRYLPDYLAGRPVPVASLAAHLGWTAFFIALLVVGAARIKTRVDFLSPIELVGPGTTRARARWRVWYALAAGPGVYLGLRLGFKTLELETLSVGAALVLKIGVSLAVAFLTALWAVRSALEEMESQGLDEHRYVRLHRFLGRWGYLARRA
jgi:hypothetical protein